VITAANVSSTILSVTGTVTFATTASNINIGTSQVAPTLTLGGTAQTGTMTLGRSTVSQTTNIQAGATASGSTKTINLGTNGVSGSTTVINIGDANGTTVTVSGTTNLANVNVSGNVSAGGSISGNGATLSAINASNISSGTIANARTTASEANGASTIVSRDSSGSFTANVGTFTSVSGNGIGLTAINASNIASGTIANARTTAATANGASTIVLRGASGEFAAGAITGTSFSGNGSAITAINATAITTGTLDNARTNATSANGASTLVVRDANGSFAGNVITGTTGTFTNISGNATSLTAINASNISSGTIANARTTGATANGASTIVLRGTSGEFSAGIITADGSGLSAINASNISSGTVASARISGSYTGITGVGTLAAGTWNANVIGNVYTTANSANGASTIVARDANGSFTANVGTFTTVSGAGGGLTSINASNISSGTIANARTTAATANGASTIVLRGTSGEFTAGAITGVSFTGSGAALSAINASNLSSGTVATARISGSYTGITGVGTISAGTWQGTSISTTYTDAKVTSATAVAGTGISVSSITTTGAATHTITNTGVTSLTGTANQITVSASTGSVTLSTPQAIATGSSVQFGSFGVGTAASGTTGEIRATNNVTAFYSDERLKTKTGNIENALDKVCQIETMLYHANEVAVALGYDASIPEVGVTAQSVQKVQPEIVVPAPIDDKYLTVRYEKLIPLLIEAIKELKAEVDALKGK
jgi:effector-binding domain-containing protein